MTHECYEGGFTLGDIAIYRGPLAIDGEVTVVAWTPEKWEQEGCVGNFRFREGLVPVYSAQHPSTRFWWVHPHQLTRRRTEG